MLNGKYNMKDLFTVISVSFHLRPHSQCIYKRYMCFNENVNKLLEKERERD